MNDGIDDSPEYVLIYKPLLEQGIVKEIFDIENVIKGLEYYLSIIENEKDREKLKPLIEEAISDDAVDDALDKILTLFPDSKCPIPVLVEIIKDCSVYNIVYSRRTRMPSPTETVKLLDKITPAGKAFIEKIEALHPENWTTIAYLDPSTGTGVLSDEDFKDWDDFLEKTKNFLRKIENIKKGISKRKMQGRTNKGDVCEDRADKECAYLKLREIFTAIVGEEPSMTTWNGISKRRHNHIYSGKLIDLSEILFPCVLSRTEIGTFNKNKTGATKDNKRKSK